MKPGDRVRIKPGYFTIPGPTVGDCPSSLVLNGQAGTVIDVMGTVNNPKARVRLDNADVWPASPYINVKGLEAIHDVVTNGDCATFSYMGVEVTIGPSAGTDGAVVVFIDTAGEDGFEPDGSDGGPGIRINLNDWPCYEGVAYENNPDE